MATAERYSFASNTIYGRLVVTPTRYDDRDGSIPGNGRTIATSSLFRCDDYVGAQYFPTWLNLWGQNIGYSLFYWNSGERPPRVSTVTVGHISEMQKLLVEQIIVTQAQNLLEGGNYGNNQTNEFVSNITFPGDDITVNGYENDLGQTYQDAVNGGYESEWFTSVGYPSYTKTYDGVGTFVLNTYCDEIYFLGTQNPIETGDYSDPNFNPGPYNDPTGWNSGYDFLNIGGSFYEDENGNRVSHPPIVTGKPRS